MKYLANVVLKLMVESSLIKVIGYFLISYNNSTETMVQKLLVYPMIPRLEYIKEVKYPKLEHVLMVKEKESEMFLTSYYKDVMFKLMVEKYLKEVLCFMIYVKIIIDHVIFNTLMLIPKVVAKMLTTKKGKQARKWYLKVFIHDEEGNKERYDKNISNFINPVKRINWLNRIMEIQKLISIYKIRSLKIRKLIKIISNETIDLNTMEMRWHIPPEWICNKSITITNNVKKIIKEYIYQKMEYILDNEIEYIEQKFVKLNDEYAKATLKKVNGKYSISIKHMYWCHYVTYDIEQNKTINKKFPSEEYYKYTFDNNGEISVTVFNKSNKASDKQIFRINDAKYNDVPVHEIQNCYVQYFSDIFIKGFKLVGIDIPYAKEFTSLEHYFRYPYISNNIYKLRYFLCDMIDIDHVDNSDPSIMKMIWNKLNIPKSIRTKNEDVIKMYLMMEPIDTCNRLKYINVFYPKIEELKKKQKFYISCDDIVLFLNILFIYKRSLLNNLDRIVNYLINDEHFTDTLNMLRHCVREYPEEVSGYLNRFQLEELHDKLTIEIAKMKDKEIEIPYKYENVFKDQKIFDLNDGYEIHIPVCKKDLVSLGNALSICVGSSSYYSNMIKNHNGYIFMMYYKGKPYGCIQWENNRISQAMLEYNNPMVSGDKIAYSKLVEFTQKYAESIHINSPRILW